MQASLPCPFHPISRRAEILLWHVHACIRATTALACEQDMLPSYHQGVAAVHLSKMHDFTPGCKSIKDSTHYQQRMDLRMRVFQLAILSGAKYDDCVTDPSSISMINGDSYEGRQHLVCASASASCILCSRADRMAARQLGATRARFSFLSTYTQIM